MKSFGKKVGLVGDKLVFIKSWKSNGPDLQHHERKKKNMKKSR